MTTIKQMDGRLLVDDLGANVSLESKIKYFLGIYKANSETKSDANLILVSNKQFVSEQEIAGIRVVPVRNIQPNMFWVGIGEVTE